MRSNFFLCVVRCNQQTHITAINVYIVMNACTKVSWFNIQHLAYRYKNELIKNKTSSFFPLEIHVYVWFSTAKFKWHLRFNNSSSKNCLGIWHRVYTTCLSISTRRMSYSFIYVVGGVKFKLSMHTDMFALECAFAQQNL